MANDGVTNGYPLLRVDWKDAHAKSEWCRVEDLNHELVMVRSIGYRIHESEETVTLAATISKEDGKELWNDIQVIPKSLITTTAVLTEQS